MLDDLDAQAALRVGVGRAGLAAGHALEDGAAGAAGQADALGHPRDRADLRVLALVPGHEQHAVLRPGIDRERDVHGREDDGVVQGDQEEGGCHQRSQTFELLNRCRDNMISRT